MKLRIFKFFLVSLTYLQETREIPCGFEVFLKLIFLARFEVKCAFVAKIVQKGLESVEGGVPSTDPVRFKLLSFMF